MGKRGGHWQSVLGQQGGGAGACRQIPGRAVQPERRGETALPDSPAIKGRNTPARLPPRFPAPGKCTSHLGFGLDSFDNQITFTGLVRCTRELFAGGHYSLAVEKAFVYVENLVKKRSGVSGKYGSNLMKTVFSVQNPFIKLNAGVTDSDRDEQLGYMEVFAGAMTGIRNPRAHAHDWIDEPKEALELLVFANHLVRKILMPTSSRNPR